MCYNPMVAYKTNVVNPDTGKYQYKFVGALANYLGESGEDHLRAHGYIDLPLTIDRYVDIETGELSKPVVLPCGQCLECRCKYAQQWANRIMLESQYHEHSYFITLTYDEAHVPRVWPSVEYPGLSRDYCDPKTGRMVTTPWREYRGDEVMSLCPKDLQDFIKRLRRYQEYHYGNIIRYYAVGEYGATYHRPHYHIIVFGLQLEDIVEVGRSKHGSILHDSPTIRKIWGNGITEVDEMTWETAAYCARYTVKKLGKKESDFYTENCLIPEFSRMSLKPAIGATYLEEHMDDIYKFDEIHIATARGGRTVKPPKYFDDKYDDVYPEDMADIRGNRREIAERATVSKLANYTGTYYEYLQEQARRYRARNDQLQRNLI